MVIDSALLLAAIGQHGPVPTDNVQRGITSQEFVRPMQTVAEGWNDSSARKAADFYLENAVYTEPPDEQVYVGREALYEFFGADEKPDPPTKMLLHHLAFNEEDQIGFGEYTFQMNNRDHGIVVVRIEKGKIANRREHQYKSTPDWKDFQGGNHF